MKTLFQLLFTLLFIWQAAAQNKPEGNFVIINPGDTPEQIIEKAANVTPSHRQYEWQRMEFIGFVHFGINTFLNLEWGKKNMDIKKFNPKKFDANQWVRVLKDAGMKEIILTAKHHDGFCLWQTKYNHYNIAYTPFENGKGDIVRDLSKACHKAGLKFGVYLSPWDMHAKTYGTPAYNTYFENLLTELLTKYGKISEVWFDGANGEGPNGKKQIYDWHAYYKLIRKLQPDAVIAIMGPDVRWVGTESGYGRQTEWSVLPGSSSSLENIAANSQQKDLDNAFVPKDLTAEDLGSREKIEHAKSLIWYPAEVDVSIRPRWFYHKDDDELVKSPYKLVDIYYNSVGLNDVLLLNVPPDKNGLVTKYDIKALRGMRNILDETFKNNLVKNAVAEASNEKKGFEARNILDNNYNTYWTTSDTTSTASIEIKLDGEKSFNRAMLQENILAGQRIEKFHLEYFDGNDWKNFAAATTIGYKRLLRFPEVTTDKVKIVIDQCRTNPTLSTFGLFMAPPEVKIQPDGGTFTDTIHFNLTSNEKGAGIFYTLDGKIPDKNSLKYSDKVVLNKTTKVTAIAISPDGKKSLPVMAVFGKAKYGVKYNSEFDSKYPGGGNYALVDGLKGSTNFNDGRWQGFNGSNLDVVIDLGKVKKIKKISTDFLRDIPSFIFLPASVDFSASINGKEFSLLKNFQNDPPLNNNSPLIKKFEIKPVNLSARYIRVKAVNIGVCPPWHKGAGDKAWIFCDEVTIE